MATKRKPRAPEAAPSAPAAGTLDEWESKLTPTEKHVDEIMQKMLAGAWLQGVSERALCKEWNLSPTRVRNISAEASRRIRALLRDDPEAQKEARAAILQTFEVIRAKAMAKGDPASLRVALDATRAYGFYLGIEPAKKLDVASRTDPFEGWTAEEKLAFARDGSRPRSAVRRLAELGEDDTPVH